MGKKLIITEKPSVARDFARVLNVSGKKDGYIENGEYVISWCYGHLVSMVYPEEYDMKYKSWKLDDLPFLPKEYKYGVIKESKDQYEVIHKLLYRQDIDTVYWAGDSGKEGQTIEENIRMYGGVRNGMTELRVWIDSQTDDEIKRGIKEARPMSDYKLLGKSGIMRSIEDYSLGINFSRALSVKYGRLINDAAATESYTAIALGRVMTCVLGMVVNREREIRNFVETPFYRVVGTFSPQKFHGEWKTTEKSAYFNSPLLYKENGFKKIESAQSLIEHLSGEKGVIANIDKSISRKKAPLLFNLAELQSECTKRFKISPSQTLQVAQDLYEHKLTTYPRTDARVLTKAVSREITKNLNGLKHYNKTASFVNDILEHKKYAGLEKSFYTDDSKVTDHYAIIPTGQTSGIDRMDALHQQVYELIVRRFLSIFYPPAEYNTVKIQIDIENESFFSSAKVLKSPGYLVIAGILQEKKEEESDEETLSKEDFLKLCENLNKGDSVEVMGFEIKEGKTSPPKRYTSGNLILAMENAGNLIEDEELREQIKNCGIGTSATRGEIIEKLIRIKYLNLNRKTQIITPENLGEMIFEVVNLTVPSLLNPQMSASWEKGLEGIINGSVDDVEYRRKLEEYIDRETRQMISTDLRQEIARRINPFTGKNSKGAATRKPLGISCPVCGGELSTTAFGYGCSNYFNKEKQCKFAVGEIAGLIIPEEDFLALMKEGKTRIIDGFVSKDKRNFKAALVLEKDEENNPKISFDFSNVGPEYLEDTACPDCGSKIVIRSGTYGCSAYNSKDPDSCRFYIGKIAQKCLSESEVKELIHNGKTKTIRGFVGKNKKKFDACLVLKKNEEGKSEISFDFENVESKPVKDAVCPLCGGQIVKTQGGFGCSNYNRSKPDEGCRFYIGQIAGVKLTEAQLKELLNQKMTKTINGFKSKTGKKFSASLALDCDEKGAFKGVKFVFDTKEEELEGVNCPKCGKKVILGPFGYRCEGNTKENKTCDFFIGKIAGVMLGKEEATKLIQTGETEKIDGFISKKGSSFEAKLKLNEQKAVVFDFENR